MIVTAILESEDFITFSVEQLTGSLLAHETRLNFAKDSMEQDFKAHISLGRDAEYIEVTSSKAKVEAHADHNIIMQQSN